MLKKLLKYDLENILKFLSIFYILVFIFAILTRIFFQIENSFIINIISQILTGTTIALIFNILINSLMRNWVRFKKNLYGDESYLTHTLPVEKTHLYQSKIITASISLLLSTVVIILALWIAYYSKENIQLLKNILLPMVEAYNSTIINFLLIVSIVIFLEFTNILQAGYTGIILGHTKNQTKIGYSVLFGVISYFVIQIITLIAIFIIGLFQPNIMNLFTTTEITDLEILKVLMYIAIVIYTITLIINYFINIKLLKRGVNVD